MRYLKLFEAFESVKLSKTLNYIKDNTSKADFMKALKEITNLIDFPLSELSDDYFQYLNFNKALDLNQNYNDEACDATSEDSYPGFGVAGSVCDKGMVDRKWGKGIRKAKCNFCDGTGLKKRTTYEIKWIKFWFNQSGKFLKMTGTDGKIRPQSVINSFRTSSGGFTGEKNKYEIIDSLSLDQLRELPTGSLVKIKIGDLRREVIGVIYKCPSDYRTYIIQDECDGSAPEGHSWKKYGRYGWVIVGSGDYREAFTVKPTGQTIVDEPEEVNPYTWNAPLRIRYSSGLQLTDEKDVETYLQDAHFALVLNYLDLRKSEFKKTSQIKSEREASKQGAYALMSQEKIKQQNINKYIQQISDMMSISAEFSDIKKAIMRFMGGSLLGIYTLRNKNISSFENFIEYLLKSMTAEQEDDKKTFYDYALDNLRNTFSSNLKFNSKVFQNIVDFRKRLKKENREELEPCLDAIINLNKTIYDKIDSMNIETFVDLEIVYEKLVTIRKVYRNSKFLNLNEAYYVTEYINDESRGFDEICDIVSTEKFLENVNKFKQFIERL